MAMVKISELSEKKGNLEEAINYLQQAVVLNDSLSSRFYHLSELLLKVNQADIAKEAIEQAVDLEPKNPKYLDLLIETGILCGDKVLAEHGFQELRLVNPQNQKLESFQARINALG
jgi:tetratricopeptide (TPR) repeat protein